MTSSAQSSTAKTAHPINLLNHAEIIIHRNLQRRRRIDTSRPDAILITPYNSRSTSNSNSLHRSTRCSTRSSCTRQPYQLPADKRHVHQIEIKYCEDTSPEHQLNTAKQQHADLHKLLNAETLTIHPILLGVGGTIYTEHTLKQFKQLGQDHQRATKITL